MSNTMYFARILGSMIALAALFATIFVWSLVF